MFRIPRRYIQPLTKLAALSDLSFDKIANGLSSIGLRADYGAAFDAVARVMADRSEETDALVNLLISLHTVREHSGQSAQKFIRGLGSALTARKEFERPVAEKLLDRLSKLLELESFASTAKAIDLRIEHDHNFCTARILTDLRPIFGTSPSERPVGGLITHSLKLSYHEGMDTKHFYLSLTEEDIETLRAVLDRADEKAKSLRSLLGEAKLTVVAVPKGE